MGSRLSLTSLTIRKDANIVAIQGRCDQLGHILEDACLLNLRRKDSVKVKGLQPQATNTLSLGHELALTHCVFDINPTCTVLKFALS